MASAFELLHPGVKRKLWDMQWTELRPIQTKAIEHLLARGGDCVISSPTAGGKTEAAFLPVLSAIADDPLDGVRAMYIGPLKALINDQFGRLGDLCARLEVPVHKWHGDVGAAERKALLHQPGGVMLITPESLEAMFVLRPEMIEPLFRRLSFVVIDELHAFLASPRGAQLRSLLHRLRVRAGCDPVRIGLSATIGNFDEALNWLRPGGPKATLIRDTSYGQLKVAVRGLWRNEPTEKTDTDPSTVELAREILMACRGATNLVFANAKARIEELADELTSQGKALTLPDEIVVHHGSLSKDQREHAEARLRDERPCTAVCSNTLEMGIDIGQIDTVVQVSAPWTVTSLVQRLGRSGRKRGQPRKLRAYFVEDAPTAESDLWARLHLEFLQGVAVVELMLEKFFEPAELTRAHWSTMVQQLLSTLAETGGMTAVDLRTRIVGSGVFGPMSGGDFASLLRNLGTEDLIEQIGDGSLVLGLKGQKIVEHFSFFAAFRGQVEFRVLHGSVEIGMLPEQTAPMPGDHVLLAGRRWKVERVEPERREIAVLPSQGRKPPKFTGLGADVDPAIQEKMRSLLTSDVRPVYLDETALEILADARLAAAPYRNFQPALVESGSHAKLFLWQGSKIQRTILLALMSAGIRARDEEVGLGVDASRDAILRGLAAFVSAPDSEKLAAIAEETLHGRLLGGDKFDRYLPSPLWRRSFVAERLDMAGAERVAREILGSSDAEPQTPPESSSQPHSPDPISLRPLVALSFGGTSLTEGDDLSLGQGTVGQPGWGPTALLRDLELRLGLWPLASTDTLRAQHWALRMDRHLEGAFYAGSLAVDRIGTARGVLDLRDRLLEAGWTGTPIPGGGPRLDLICRLESDSDPQLPPGLPDRLSAIENELEGAGPPPYDEVLVADELSLWPHRWRHVFALLEARGTPVREVEPPRPPSPKDATTDLARLKAALAASGKAANPSNKVTLRGDGSFVLLRAQTSLEAAEAIAALTRAWTNERIGIIRESDSATLDIAFALQRLPTLGSGGASPWRPLLQVLPLALELMFEPRDPVRAIELLTLPGGPFRGSVGWTLARALADEPGIGGRGWLAAKRHLGVQGGDPPLPDSIGVYGDAEQLVRADRIRRQLDRVDRWIEGPLHAPATGAPRAAILETIALVVAWLHARTNLEEETISDVASAIAQVEATAEAILADTRDPLPLDILRQIVDDVGSGGQSRELWPELAGRVDHVRAAACLRSPVDSLMWWHLVDGPFAKTAALPWRRSERSAMAAAGIVPVDPTKLQIAKIRSWSQALHYTGRRLVLVVPERHQGEETVAHPFLDVIMGTSNLRPTDLEAVTVHAQDLAFGRPSVLGAAAQPSVDRVDDLLLPPEHPVWHVDPTSVALPTRWSVTSVETLLGCPLKWALRHRAKLRPVSVAEVPRPELLCGRLGHRLIEELQHALPLASSAMDDSSPARDVLDRLISTEAAVLLRSGMGFERAQLRRDLLRAVDVLSRFMHDTGFRVISVEKIESVPWQGGELHGRHDVLLGRGNEELVVDLKWGLSRYRDLLRDGHAIQLAAYVFMGSDASGGSTRGAGYYSIGRKVLVTTDPGIGGDAEVIDGPRSLDVWARTDAAAAAIRRLITNGHLPVTGVRGAKPILEVDGISDPKLVLALPAESACEYCTFGPVCGRSWRDVRPEDA